ncbi:MAG TPA: D-aminoacyl-tRNA deacylase [Thermomicrobiales bacterium]|nr:D-aminoacyl-tRNA deacylase [Thermomicrobiales bacterium]
MRICLQRVSRASVTVEEKIAGQIDAGYLILLGITQDDGPDEIELLATKVANLRVLDDERGVMNISALERLESDPGSIGILVVSQFTLYADVRKGRRPSWVKAAAPDIARPMVEAFCQALSGMGFRVEQGVFGAEMAVELINDGPVTIWLDSDDLQKPRRG